MKKRCGVCGKEIGKRGIQAPDGTLLDSPECLERYDPERGLRALQNGIRVMRSRLKARMIHQAEGVYQELGGQDWVRVRKLLAAIL